jgi:hypothetical protein
MICRKITYKKARYLYIVFYMRNLDTPGKSPQRHIAKLFDNRSWCFGGEKILLAIPPS